MEPDAKGPTAKAKRVRAPKNLAAQYGEKVSHAPRTTEATARRGRRDAQARERLQQIMTPNEEVLRRLSRAGAISTLLIADEGASRNASKRAHKPRRPRHWEWRCGKCGAKERFSTAAALCVRCGAIAVRPE